MQGSRHLMKNELLTAGKFLLLLLVLAVSISFLSGSPQSYNRALYLYDQGILIEAEREVKSYLSDSPDDYEANKLLARILSDLQDFAQLKEVTTKLLSMRANDPEVLELDRIAAAETQRSAPVTVAELEEELNADPENIGIRIRLIDIHTNNRQYQQADRHYREVIRLRPRDSAFRLRYARFLAQRGRITEAEREYLVYLSLEENAAVRREMFNVILREAYRLIEQQRYNDAIIQFREVRSRYPDDLYLLLEYARLLSLTKDYENSIITYQIYLERDDNPSVRLEMARVKSWNDNYAGALEDIFLVLEEEPNSLAAHILLGDVYRWTDNMDDSRERYEFVLSIDPDNMYALEGLKELERLEQTRYQEATSFSIEAMRAALREDPDDLHARLQLARLLNIAAEYSEASRHYEIYLQNNPNDLKVRLEYSRTLGSQGDYQGAVRQLQIYLNENQDDLTNRINLVNLYLWSEEYFEAESHLKEILREHPENLYAHWNLFRLNRNREEWQPALYHLRAIQEIEPNYRVTDAYIREIENHPRLLTVATDRAPSPYKPTLGFTYGFMRDHENYSERYGLFRYQQPLKGNSFLELAFGRYFLNQKIPDSPTLVVETDRYSLLFSGWIDEKTSGRILAGMNEYNSRYQISKTESFFFGATLSYQLDELNRLSVGYYNDDAVYFVKTVRSLEAGISVDRFEVEWEREAIDRADGTSIPEKLTYFGNFVYGMFSDNNKQIRYRIGISYPLSLEPLIDLQLGWDALSFSEQKETELYWSPRSYDGLYFGGKTYGEWQEFTYGLDAEVSFRRNNVGASRSISGRLYYLLTESINAGVVLSYSESPREDDTDYNYLTSIFELYYRF